MGAGYGFIVSSIILTTTVGFLLNSAGYMAYTIISPIVFIAGEVLLMAAIALANTPLLKGVATALFGAWLFVFFLTINIPIASPYKEFVYSIVFIPSFIGVGMELLEAGKG